jgi:hypothetical protein
MVLSQVTQTKHVFMNVRLVEIESRKSADVPRNMHLFEVESKYRNGIGFVVNTSL